MNTTLRTPPTNALSHASPVRLTDRVLLWRLRHLVGNERESTSAVVAHLAELDERRLYLGEGFPSLFAYCTRELHYSEGAAFNRIEAARTAREYPLVLKMLAAGEIHLTAVRLLRPHMTADNHRELLGQARHRSRREIEEMVAAIRPKPDAYSMVRRVPHGAGSPKPANDGQGLFGVIPEGEDLAPDAPMQGVASARQPIPETPSPPSRLTPLSPERFKVQFTASRQLRDRLLRLQELLRHRIPDGNLSEIVDLATLALLEKVEKEKFAAGNRPRALKHAEEARKPESRAPGHAGEDTASTAGLRRKTGSPRADSRHIPAEVRREVWARDQGRCAFRSRNGRRCEERNGLEFHHLEPFAVGGRSTAENIALRCRAHNRHEAEVALGKPTLEGAMRVRDAAPGEGYSFRNELDRAGPEP